MSSKDKTKSMDFVGKEPKAYWKAAPGINVFTNPTSPTQHLYNISKDPNLDSKTKVIETCKALHHYENNLFLTSDMLEWGAMGLDLVSYLGYINTPKTKLIGGIAGLVSTSLTWYNYLSFNPKVEKNRSQVNELRLRCTYDEAEKTVKKQLRNASNHFNDRVRVKKILKGDKLTKKDKDFIIKQFNQASKELQEATGKLQDGQKAIHSKVDGINDKLDKQGKQLDGIETNVTDLVNAHNKGQEQKKEQTALQQKIEKYQNTLAIATFVLGKFDPKVAHAVNTVGSCALGIGMAIAISPPGIGTALGIITAALPIFDLFGGKERDVAAERHEEVMEALRIISDQINQLHKQMHERFDMVHKHLDTIVKNIDSQFKLVFNQLDRVNSTLKGIVGDIKRGQDLNQARLNNIEETIKFGQELNTQIWQQYYKHEYEAKIALLKSNVKTETIDKNIGMAFNEIYKYAYLVSEGGIFNKDFKSIVEHRNANILQNQDINYFLGYVNQLESDKGSSVKVPNFYLLADGVNKLIYYDILFHGRYDVERNKVYLKDLLKKSENSKEIIQKLAQSKFIKQKYEEYKRIADKVLASVYLELKNIEQEAFKGITTIPTTYHLEQIACIEPFVFIQLSSGSSNRERPYRFFKEKIGKIESTYYTKYDNNVLTVYRRLGYIKLLNFNEVENRPKAYPAKGKDHLYTVTLTGNELIKTGAKGVPLWATIEPYSDSNLKQDEYACLHLDEHFDRFKHLSENDRIFDITRDVYKEYAKQGNLSNKGKTKGEELNFIELLYAKLNEKYENEKRDLAKKLEEKFLLKENFKQLKSEFEKAGVALLFYSTLNRVSTDSESVLVKGYKIDYEHEIYTFGDVLSYVERFARENYLKTGNYWKGSIKLKVLDKELTLDGNRLIDVVFLRLYKQLHTSVGERMASLQEIYEGSMPPILASTIQKLEWYRDLPDE